MPSQNSLWVTQRDKWGPLVQVMFGAPILVNCNDLEPFSGCIYRISKRIAPNQ